MKNNKIYLAVGIFDGLHIGHQKLINKLLIDATDDNAKSVVLTFWPHPKHIINNSNLPIMLYSLEQRRQMLLSYGVDFVKVKRFNKAFAAYSPQKFMQFISRLFPQITSIYVGENFRFGNNQEGDTDTLKNICGNKISLNVVSTKLYDNQCVSSTRIRKAVSQNNINDAEILLGHKLIIK